MKEVDTQAVFLQSSNYLAVNVNSAELQTFYTNQQANYRIPERVQVAYVKFEAPTTWLRRIRRWREKPT